MTAFKFTMTTMALCGVFAAHQPALAGPCDAPLTRAEVVAAMMAARSSGELAAYNAEDSGSEWLARRAFAATPVARAVAAAPLVAMTGEDSGSFALARELLPNPRTRAEVHAEAVQANRLASHFAVVTGGEAGTFLLPPPAQVVAAAPTACPMPVAQLHTVAR